jgi:hypothetical protein
MQDKSPGRARTCSALAPAAHEREQRIAQHGRHFIHEARPALGGWSLAADGRRLPQAAPGGQAGGERGVAQVRERGGQQQRDDLAPARRRPPLCRRQEAP